MTGVLSLAGAAGRPAAAKHLRMLVRFSGGSELAFYDTRRFGTAFLLAAADSDTYWRRLGPEPLDRSFNQARMLEITSGRSRPIKNLLLDQSLVAGIGNIYADESLFLARIHPLRPAGSLTPGEAGRLVKGIKETLRRAIRLQGSSIDTYRDSRGRAGRFQDTFRVHRREGKPCPGCGGTVKKTRVGGRGTYYCPSCQHL
jgi:formamidopyrimidine-DNA glycosylase